MKLQTEKGSIGSKALVLLAVFAIAVLACCAVFLSMELSLLSPIFALLLFFASSMLLYLYGACEAKIDTGVKKLLIGMLFCVASAVLSAFAIVQLYQAVALDRTLPTELFTKDGLLRVFLLFWIMLLVNCHVAFDTVSVQNWIFRYRWLIAGSAFVILVACKVHFSNIACFDFYIQPDSDTAFTNPLFGVPRGIRSDEWLVTTPRKISAEYSNYAEFNNIVCATENYSISSSYLYFSYSAFSNVMNLGYYLFGSEAGVSFYWCAAFILNFMVAFELSYILAKKNRYVALLGAVLIALSSYSLWWSINPPFLISAQAAIVCVYYFFETEKRYQRVLLALGVAVSGCHFVCDLYPAWQVPAAYIVLAFLVWIFATHIEQVKKLRVWDWLIVAGALCFMGSVVVAYLHDSSYYIEAVMSTVYPGARFDTGGYSLDKAMSFAQGLLFPFKDIGNNSEAGTFFNLFPLPMLLAVVTLIRQIYQSIRYREKSVDSWIVILLIPTVFLTAYCTVGLPDWLAKYSLMSYTTSFRAIDFLGLLNVYFLIRFMGSEKQQMRFPIWLGTGLVFVTLLKDLTVTEQKYSGYMPAAYIAVVTVIVLALGLVYCCRIGEQLKKRLTIALIAVFLIPGVSVLPVTRGLDSVLEKPASHAVQDIVANDPDAKWIAYNDIVSPQFLIANGAPTVNSVNYIPNMTLWSQLDPEGVYNEVYNRYSHVVCSFTDEQTWFELLTNDSMHLHLSYSDLSTVGVRYVFSLSPVEEASDLMDLKLLYQEENVSIYEVIYLS